MTVCNYLLEPGSRSRAGWRRYPGVPPRDQRRAPKRRDDALLLLTPTALWDAAVRWVNARGRWCHGQQGAHEQRKLHGTICDRPSVRPSVLVAVMPSPLSIMITFRRNFRFFFGGLSSEPSCTAHIQFFRMKKKCKPAAGDVNDRRILDQPSEPVPGTKCVL